MDADRFDALTRSLFAAASSRRRLLLAVSGAALSPLAAALGVADARATHFQCRHVGASCRRDRQCCSSKCRNKRCKAHYVGGCQPVVGSGTCFTGVLCRNNCSCTTTTGGAGYCSDGNHACIEPPCTTDKDCEEFTGRKGVACVECSLCSSTGGAACMFPCPTH